MKTLKYISINTVDNLIRKYKYLVLHLIKPKCIFWERYISLCLYYKFEIREETLIWMTAEYRYDVTFISFSGVSRKQSVVSDWHSLFILKPFIQRNTSRTVCITWKRFIRKAGFVTFNNVCATVKMYAQERSKLFSIIISL